MTATFASRLVTLCLLAGAAIAPLAASGQSGGNLLPPASTDAPLQGRGGWTKQMIDARLPGVEETAWIAKVKERGQIYFEANTSLSGVLKLRRSDLKFCKRIKGSITLEGNGPRAGISEGSSNVVQLGAGKNQGFTLALAEVDSPLFLMIQVAGLGKIWGTIDSLSAEGCN